MKGEPIDAQTLQAEESARLAQSAPPYGNTIARQPVSASDFALQFTPGKRYRVIDVIHNELITHSHSSVYSENGFDRDDVSFIAVLERYGQRLAPACGLLGGFGLNEGTLAATVSHDSHNIVVIGRSAEEMALAVNQVIQDGGGLCVVRNGQVQSHLPLPIAGLMSTDTAQSLAEQIDALKAAARECGPLPDEPFIQMAFLSLPVIPALKLPVRGCLMARSLPSLRWKSRNNKKKPGVMPGKSHQLRLCHCQLLNFFLAADFAFFHHRHYRHQADTTNRGDIQRGEGACPAGKAKYRRPISNHSQT